MNRAFTYFLSGSAYMAGIGLTISSAWLITTASFQPPLQALSIAIVAVRFFGISRSVARYVERVMSHQSVLTQLTGVRVKLFESIATRPLALIRDSGSGRLVKRVVDDVERAQEYELRVSLPHGAAAIALLTGVALGGWIRPQSLLVMLPAALVVLLIIPNLVKSRSHGIAARIESLESHYVELVHEASHGALEAKLYGYLEQRLEKISKIEKQLCDEERKLNSANRFFQFSFVGVIGVTLFALANLANGISSKIPAVQVTILIFLPLVIFEAVVAFYPSLFLAGKMILARAEISSIQSHSISTPKILKELVTPASHLEVRNVKVRWGNQRGEAPLSSPISFSLDAGESLALRGRSGVGKTTFALGIFGVLEYEGEILVNGVELRSLKNPSEHIVGTIQNSHIFNTSVRENLKIAAPNASDDQLMEVLKIVELDDLVAHMEVGLDTLLGEFGREISGGEAKRLSLARALLSSAQILVLDEPTEHLDDELAKRIERRVLSLARTFIVITHSGWDKCTKRVVME